MVKKQWSLYIPVSFNLIVLTNKKKSLTIILYNKNISMNFAFSKNNVKIDLNTYSLKLLKINKTNNNYNFKEINKYFKTFEIFFFIKIKFKGKGFKIKFNKKFKLIKFYFGRSHITLFKFKKINFKKVTKYKFILKSMNLAKLKKKSSEITFIKPVNLYTLRGIRLSRQIISKRKGKKSSYI